MFFVKARDILFSLVDLRGDDAVIPFRASVTLKSGRKFNHDSELVKVQRCSTVGFQKKVKTFRGISLKENTV